MKIEFVEPKNIEKRSFEIIIKELKEDYDTILDSEKAPLILRAIHTSADFSYAKTLYFSPDIIDNARKSLVAGATIVTDTSMALSGINKKALSELGINYHCFIADEDVAIEAKERGVTRSSISMERAAKIDGPLILAIGNAPTALIKIRELFDAKKINPQLVIGVPVGFVNVVPAKELIVESGMPCIVNRGRKGGSNVAAALINALIYTFRAEREALK